MTQLYSQLAIIYHEMYQSIFDYKKEFKFYDTLLKKYKCKKILEIGCGTGNLAPLFLKARYDYLGLDLSKDMLKIAKQVAPKAQFVKGDMRKLQLKETFDAILITGRSFTYMTTNEDVMNALTSVHKHLKKNGILIFDNFNAERFFTEFKENTNHTAKYNGKEYKRVSKNAWNMKTGWTWNWNATYHIKEHGKTQTITDASLLRAFTEDELKLFLGINGFDVQKIIKENVAMTAIAKKL